MSDINKGFCFRSYEIAENLRDFLLKTYKPAHDVVVAHHITVGINPDFNLSGEPDFTGLKIPSHAEITAHVRGPGLEAFDVVIDGKIDKPAPDGRPFHITYSRESGAVVPPEMLDYLSPADQDAMNAGKAVSLGDHHANSLVAMIRDYQRQGLPLPEGYSVEPIHGIQIAQDLQAGFFKVEDNGSFVRLAALTRDDQSSGYGLQYLDM